MTVTDPHEANPDAAEMVDPVEAEAAAEARHRAELARLEAEVARRRAADADAERRPAAPLSDLAAALQARLATRPRSPADEWAPPPVEDLEPAARQRLLKQQVWRQVLIDAHHDSYLDASIDDLGADQNPQAMRRFADAVGNRDAPIRTLILGGKIGAGKTRAAIAVGNHCAAAGLFVRFVKHSAYLSWLRPDGNPPGVSQAQIRHRHRTCDLLIVDDLGAELERDASDFVRGETNDLIGDRVAARRATIVTTNLKADRITELLGERLMSRLGTRAFVATFLGPDRRTPVTW